MSSKTRNVKLLFLYTIVAVCCQFAHASQRFQSVSDKLLGGTMALPLSGTITLMVNPHFSPSDGLYHIFFEVMQPVDHGFQVLAGPGTMLAGWDTGPHAWAKVPDTLTLNAWTNITVTWVNGAATTMYINGAQVATIGPTIWLDTTGFIWSFGNRYTGGYDAHSDLAQFGIWNRVLTSAEISSLGNWASPSTFPSGLIAEYDLAGPSLTPQSGGVGPLVASGPILGADLPAPPAAVLSMTGPPAGTVGAPSFFTLGGNHIPGSTVVTLSDGGASGTFLPPSVTLVNNTTIAPFTYIPARGGNIAISTTNDQSVANPAPLTLQVTAIPPSPTLSVNSFSNSVAQGRDAAYTITQSIPAGYTGEMPALRVFNAPAGFTFSINGADCGVPKAAIANFNWSNCGPTPAGTYTLTVHTGSLPPGAYFFSVTESVKQSANGSGLTLTLTVN